jgi:hypothetical protein
MNTVKPEPWTPVTREEKRIQGTVCAGETLIRRGPPALIVVMFFQQEEDGEGGE